MERGRVESWDRDLLTKDPTGDAFALIALAILYVPASQKLSPARLSRPALNLALQ